MKIFISYRRAEDNKSYLVGNIHERLVAEFGAENVFRDTYDISGGQEWKSVLERAANECKIMLVVIGPDWVSLSDPDGRKRLFDPNDVTRWEVETGLKRSREKQATVIPVLVLEAGTPKKSELPETLWDLLEKNCVRLRNYPDFNRDFEILVRDIRASQSFAGGDMQLRHYEREAFQLSAQQQFADLPVDLIPEVSSLPDRSRMPLSRNPLFIGRSEDLCRLAKLLKENQTVAITGLGGMGKTQLAVEFAHRYGRFFAGGVFWLSFADENSVPAEIALCGGSEGMNLPGFRLLQQVDQIARVRQEWQEALPRLLIFDNCEEEQLLATYKPSSSGCRVLLTSRRPQWDELLEVHVLALGILDRDESRALLRRLRPDVPPTTPDLDAIAAELGDLPLALHLAGSFLKLYRDDISLADYLAELKSAPLLEHESLQGIDLTVSATNHPLHVGRTFALSYDQLDPSDTLDALAMRQLACAACLAPGELIPRSLLLSTLNSPGTMTRGPGSRALHRLFALGLMEAEGEARQVLRLHPLLHAFVKGRMVNTAAQEAVEQALIAAITGLDQKEGRARMLALQSHFRHVTESSLLRAWDERTVQLCRLLGAHLEAVGDFLGARRYYEHALAICETLWGPDDLRTADSLSDLGWLSNNRRHLERALAIRERLLRPDSEEVVDSLNRLGRSLQGAGEFSAAKPYYLRALDICEGTPDPRHPETATTLDNLGKLFADMGDYPTARQYMEKALAVREQVLRPDDPRIAWTLNNLGGLLHLQGDLSKARSHLERALEIYKKLPGPVHPDIVTSLNLLGRLFKDLDDLPKARAYLESALPICQRVWGVDHPQTGNTLQHLGKVLWLQEDLEAAHTCLVRALEIYDQMKGSDHPDTGGRHEDLALLLELEGDLAGARIHLERAVEIYEGVLGPDHHGTARGLGHLGRVVCAQGDLKSAVPILERALDISERVLGVEDLQTARVLNDLGQLYRNWGDLTMARRYTERSLSIFESRLGSDHRTTRQVRTRLLSLNKTSTNNQ